MVAELGKKMGINIFAFGIYLEIDIQPQKIHT